MKQFTIKQSLIVTALALLRPGVSQVPAVQLTERTRILPERSLKSMRLSLSTVNRRLVV